ncbi:MAG: DUF5681 domain-containing protein [bacterium]
MPFEPGKSGNPSGRPKGQQNRTTEQIRDTFLSFINDNMSGLQESFDKLEPKDKLQFIEKIAKLILPRPLNELERLPEDQFQELIGRLQNN